MFDNIMSMEYEFFIFCFVGRGCSPAASPLTPLGVLMQHDIGFFTDKRKSNWQHNKMIIMN
jgi:hypothetical protein